MLIVDSRFHGTGGTGDGSLSRHYGFSCAGSGGARNRPLSPAILLPSKLILDKPAESHRPVSATKDFWNEWDTNCPNNAAIAAAVNALRKQCR